MNKSVLKVIRYIAIYGFVRAFVKVEGRLRLHLSLLNFKKKRDISIIGCGQFPFSTIAYFLFFNRRGNFLGCYDIVYEKAKSLGRFYGMKKIYSDVNDLLNDEKCKLIYIASNHSTHTDYAIEALKRNIDVYIEKPISVSNSQFNSLREAIQESKASIYVGYNRPHSKAIKYIDLKIKDKQKPITLNCFITGHKIEKDHWYRNPEEGTRVCGNMGHWIDLMVHLFAQRGYVPRNYFLQIAYANIDEFDDNIIVNIRTDFEDIISICLTSRSEPFEGINETISLQCDDIIAKIDDFRKLTFWQGDVKINKIFWPKDVGHKEAIMQPFREEKRNFREVEVSTLLMLEVKHMVINQLKSDTYSLNDDIK